MGILDDAPPLEEPGAVKIIYQRIYVDVRMSEPHSLDELNLALWEKLEELNDAPLNDGDSRRADFEANERKQLSALPPNLGRCINGSLGSWFLPNRT